MVLRSESVAPFLPVRPVPCHATPLRAARSRLVPFRVVPFRRAAVGVGAAARGTARWRAGSVDPSRSGCVGQIGRAARSFDRSTRHATEMRRVASHLSQQISPLIRGTAAMWPYNRRPDRPAGAADFSAHQLRWGRSNAAPQAAINLFHIGGRWYLKATRGSAGCNAQEAVGAEL